MEFLNELNTQQREAVMAANGPVMIIAGAGSGKTRVLTYRIAFLLAKGIDPFRILALTFTNKAAREMKERIAKVVGIELSRNLWMGTFHSVFAKILRIEHEKIGFPSNFTIYDTDDAKSLLKSIIKELKLDDKVYKPSLVLSRISQAKNNLISASKYAQDSVILADDAASKKPYLHHIYNIYQERCFRAGAMDFDDLLFKTNVLLRNDAQALKKYQDKFHYILVDEFQDTNFAQFSILKQLAALRENICVVGDDAQSIYAFRGANIQNILNFKSIYPDTQVFKLEQNYRSTQNIVEAANSLIKKNKEQLDKKVWTANIEGEKVKVFKTNSDTEEGMTIAKEIFRIKNQYKETNNSFAILYRTNAQSRALEEALRKMDIPYKIYGGLSFYHRKEIKDLLAYFRLSVNPNDEEALKRIINFPTRGIGNTTLEKLFLASNHHQVSIWKIIENLHKINTGINASTLNKLQNFCTTIKTFQIIIQKEDAFSAGHHIATNSGLLKEFFSDRSVEGISRHENIQELLAGLKEFTENQKEQGLPNLLSDYMSDIALLTDQDDTEKENADRVSLMTIHAAKGLEFPYVFVAGLEENLFPSQLSINSRTELEEERRLFYVAITRAEKKAHLSYAITRFKYGQLIYCEPSRFIEEISLQYLDFPQQKQSSPFNTNNTFNTLIKPSLKPTFTTSNTVKTTTTFKPSDVSEIMVGCEVEHERFGKGKVLNLEGTSPDIKATVFFQGLGQKQLLLKFAKLKVL